VSFVHDDPEFQDLLRIVARERGLAVPLVEKDYWVTHALWALHETGLAISFKGGTSLSKGFGLIERFSEDLDLQIDAGLVKELPRVTNWKSENKGPIAERREFFVRLTDFLRVPSCSVSLDEKSLGGKARGANYRVEYPGAFVGDLEVPFRPFVLLEVGRARVHPFDERPLSSFVHDKLDASGQLDRYELNRPQRVRCLHPLVTLLEKLENIAKRYEHGDPAAFVRHCEDAARIIEDEDQLPSLEGSLEELIEALLEDRTIRNIPRSDDSAFSLEDSGRRGDLEQAREAIDPMFWGKRVSIEEAAERIRGWPAKIEGPES
jgi:hypothetical protein